jgi:hypothetical protein
MSRSKSSLIRSLSLGFALGGLLVALVMGTGLLSGEGGLVGAANAAPISAAH